MKERDLIRDLISKGLAANYTPDQFAELIQRIYKAGFSGWEEHSLAQYCRDQSRYNERQIENKINALFV